MSKTRAKIFLNPNIAPRPWATYVAHTLSHTAFMVIIWFDRCDPIFQENKLNF